MVTANFEEITYDPFQITYLAPENGSYTVDGTSVGSGGLVSETKTKVYNPKLVATATGSNAFVGWYEDGAKVSDSPTYTPAYTASHTVVPKFASATVVTTLADLQSSVQSNPLTEVPSGTTIIIPSGQTVTVASGNTLIVNGTIWVEGTLNGSAGSVTVGGTLAKLTKSYVQKGQNGATGADAQPYNPYGTVKYWITSTETVSGVSVSGATASSFVRITNGKGTVYRAVLGTNDPVAIICTKDSSAVNLVTGITNTSETSTEKLLTSYTDKLHILCKDASDSSRTSKADYKGVTDLAGYKLTIGKKGINSYSHTILNGSYEMTIPSSTGGLYGTLTCIKCSAITIANFVNKYWTTMNFYDCTPADYITRFEVSTTGSEGKMNYYSGGPYPIASIKTPEDIFHIYGGSWTGKPDDARIAESLKSDYKFYQHDDGYWYLEKKGDEVMNVDGTEYKDLSAAIAAVNSALSSKSSVKMEMLKSATISTPFTVPSGKTLEIELAGCCITAPNGLVTNNGAFIIGDKYASIANTGARVVTSGGSWITNNGTADVTYGYYDGNITLNGGTFTTHHGYFTGTISGTAERAVLKGGYFAQDVSAYLKDGYYRTDGYVGPFPKAGVSKIYTNSGYWKYTITLLPKDDLTLYTNTKTEKSDYSDADWKRKAEIKSMVQPYLTKYTVDYTIAFDRNVASGTVTANVEKPSIVGERTLDVAVEAAPKGLYRILSKELAEPTSPFLSPANQKWYADCFADSTFHEVVFGVYSSATDNQGTTADLRVDFCQGANGTDISKLTTKLNIASEYTVIGAGQTNQAMIQPASGKATFYATVAEAVDACAKGGTIKLCNDISGSISVGKECSLDVNGMNVTGDIVAGAGFTMSVSESTPDVEKYLGKNHKVYTFTPITYNISYTLNGGTNHADNPKTYTVESETITLKDPTRTDYNFTGWTPAGTIAKGSTGDKTFMANWELALVTITIPDVAHMTKTISCSEGEATLVSGTTYQVKPGVTVTVTYTADAGYSGGKVCVLENASAGATIPDVPTAKTITYTIAYELNGGENDPANPATYTVESETITLLPPTKEDYTFIRWDGGNVIPQGSTGNKTFTAVWKLTTVTITIEDVPNTTKTIVCSEGTATLASVEKYQVQPDVTVTVTYRPNADYYFEGVDEVVVEGVAAEGLVLTTEPPRKYAAKIGTAYYKELSLAISAAGEGQTVQVLTDAGLSTPIAIGDTTPAYTLDLNAHIVTGAVNLAQGRTMAIENPGLGTLFDVTTAVDPTVETPVVVTTGVADPIFFQSATNAYWATTNAAGQVVIATASNPVVKDTSGAPVEIEIPQTWRDEQKATGEEIMRPEQPMQNGLPAWQNYVLGIDPTNKLSGIYADTPQNTSADTVTVVIRNLDQVDPKTGYEITGYQLIDDEGKVIDEKSVPSFDISITGEASGLYRLSAIIRKDGQTLEQAAETVNIVGLVKQVQAVTNAIISVPWGKLAPGDEAIAVSNVVKTATLSEGDELRVYRPGKAGYELWTLDANKQWQPRKTLKLMAKGQATMEEARDPESADIPKGSGIWLCRKAEHVNEPYYLYGQYDGDESAVDLVKGSNLIGATGVEGYDLNAHILNARPGDTVVVPGEKDVPTVYEFKNGAWGCMTTTTTTIIFKGKEETAIKNVWTTDKTIKPGTGFWLHNNSGKIIVK